MEACEVSIWPRLEPFLLGALPAAPPAKLALHYLRKMARYVRTREGCFPRLGWHMWRHIACGKLQLRDELAWLYFHTFDLLSSWPAEERLQWAEALSQSETPRQLDRQRCKLSVDTLQFLLFLYLQQLNRVSLRTSLIGEEWPSSRSRSPSSSSEREAKTISQNKNWDDQAHLSFVHTHLAELLELLAEPGELGDSGQATRDTQLSPDALRALSLLLEGRPVGARAVLPLHRLLGRAPTLQTQAGFSKLSCSYSLHKLHAWLLRSLALNPFAMSSCLRSGNKLAWALQVEGALKRAKIARSTHSAPAGSRLVLMSQVYKQTLAKDSEKLAGAHVKIHRCSDAFIYLLSPLRSATLDKCRNTTVVLGPVETSVHMQSCESVRLVCVASRLLVGGSQRCSVHALTPTRPLLLPGNAALTLGPFHTHYPALEDHMASAGIAVVPNLWDRPLVYAAEATDAADPDSSLDSACYRILPPDELRPLVVPFQMEGDTCEVPGGLPQVYQKAVDERKERVQDWQRTVKEANLNKEQRRKFQALVEQRFHEWLLETGQRHELDCLLPSTVVGQSGGTELTSPGQSRGNLVPSTP